jgi:hypothetical protein
MGADVTLSGLVEYVREQLHVAAESRRQRNELALLRVESVTIEVNVVVTRTKEGHGGIDLKVLTVGGAKAFEEQQVHKVVLNLRAKEPGEPQYDDDLEEE